MTVKAVNAYQVQSETEPERYHQVIIDPMQTPASRCDCDEYRREHKVCKHIERAITCHIYGL